VLPRLRSYRASRERSLIRRGRCALLVGFAAGGAFDIAARTMGQWLSDRLGQPFIIENRPGGSTNIATEAVVRAPPDGYTLLLGGGTNAINATLYEKLKFDFIKDTTPVAGIIQFPNVIAVIPSFPVKTIPDRTEEYAPRNHREAQQRDQCGARRPQDEGTVCRSGRHGAARPARRFREAHRDEIEKWAKVVKFAGLKAE